MARTIVPPSQNGHKVATAAQLRDRFIYIDVPGLDGVTLKCTRPDPLELIARDLLPLDTLHTALGNAVTGKAPDTPDDKLAADELIKRWACVAILDPKVVFSKEEANAAPDALWVEDLTPDLRNEVYRRTSDKIYSRRVSEAVQEFRDRLALGAGDRPDGAPVSD
jgi:hypothetical protein